MNILFDKDNLAPKINPQGKINFNIPINKLVEHVILNKEGVLGEKGEVICSSGKYKGRSPKDKFIVENLPSKDNIWWGKVNQKISAQSFSKIHDNVANYINKKDIYIFDGYAGADKEYQLKVRIITTKAWHCMFVNNMFIRPNLEELKDFEPDFTILNACEYEEKNWQELGLNSEVFIIFDLEKKLGLIGGTEYAGEMKKGIFSVMNYLLPLKKVMAMHCSATVGKNKDVAVYFGLSGTGKTTLSADPSRFLIGDDEHGWSDSGVFNFEGGCYAKTIKLSKEQEPDIWNAIRYGSILENVKLDSTNNRPDYFDISITENGRVSYPINYIPNYEPSGKAGHPSYIFMLTCDAFGVLPPVAKLTPQQASYHFLSGYTAKVAGTERGITEPIVTFSTCFGQPFMTLEPKVYGHLLTEKMKKHNAHAFLINTGWIGGQAGSRISLKYTRSIIECVLNGEADNCEYIIDEIFGFKIPKKLGNIPENVLFPNKSWSDQQSYQKIYQQLANMFIDNFANLHAKYAADLIAHGPKL